MSLPYRKLTFKWISAWQVSFIKITSYISTRKQFKKNPNTEIHLYCHRFNPVSNNFYTLIQFNHFYALIRISGTSGYFGIKATSVNILFIWNIFPFYVQNDYAAKTVRIT